MKRIITIMVALTALCFAAAQEKEPAFLAKKNEVKVNLPVSIFGAFPEVSYERILQEDISVGASLGFSVDGGDSYEYKFQFTPYFRWFFGGNAASMQKYAAGFFIEANASMFSREVEEHDYSVNCPPTANCINQYKSDDKFGIGMGVGIGWKYINRSSWVGEILLGVGKDFSNSGDAYPRLGISIGKRF